MGGGGYDYEKKQEVVKCDLKKNKEGNHGDTREINAFRTYYITENKV